MQAFLEIYTSSFWSWAGITFGAAVVLTGTAAIVSAIGTSIRRR